MKIKERLKNVGFWVSIISAVFVILGAFGVEIGGETASNVINGICSALMILGVISDPTSGHGYLDGGAELDVLGAVSAVLSGESDTSEKSDDKTNKE